MSNSPALLDVRAPRFGAWITAALLAVTIVLTLIPSGTATFGWFAYQPLAGAVYVGQIPLSARVSQPGFIALLIVALLFLWGALSPRTAPWGVLYRKVVAPRLAPATEFEDPRPPRFAQGVGLAVTVIGLILHIAGLPFALTVAASAAFIAAFLNAAFGVCLGCMMYLGIQRLRTSRTA